MKPSLEGRGRPQCGIAETQGGLAVYMMFARRAAQHFKSKTSHLLTIKEEHVWKTVWHFGSEGFLQMRDVSSLLIEENADEMTRCQA